MRLAVFCDLLYGQDVFVKNWVGDKIGTREFGPCAAIGVMRGPLLIAGIVYHNYIESPNGKPVMCEISMAAIDKRWANKRTLRGLFGYPFLQLKVGRVQVSTPVESKDVRIINEKLGFVYEGTGRKAHFLGGDVDVLSMLKHECKWIK